MQKFVLSLLMAALLAIGACTRQSPLTDDAAQTTLARSVKSVTITVDGNASDWAGVPAIATATGQSTTVLKVAQDATKFYFLVQGTGMGPYYDLFIDTDYNALTGFNADVWTSEGFDFLVENGALHASTGTGFTWNLIGPSPVTSVAGSTVLEVSVLKSALGTVANSIRVGVWDINSSFALRSRIPVSGNAAVYGTPPPTGLTDQLNVLVPAYFNPVTSPGYWNTLNTAAASQQDRVWAIINPDNGPGTAVDSAYVTAVNNFISAGGHPIGYVDTDFGNVPLNVVKSNIDKWYAWYSNIEGIFLDQMTNLTNWTPGKETYYQEIYEYINDQHDPNSLVVANPGSNVPESFLIYNGCRVADVLVTYENGSFFETWNPDPWTLSYDRENFCVLPYNASAQQYKSYIDNAYFRNVGWIYVTSDTLNPHPWDILPTYFQNSINYLIAYY